MENRAIMAMDDVGGESSDEDPDSEVEEQPSQESEQQEAADEDLHVYEEDPTRLPRNPEDPLPEERDKHWMTHLPYRDWCTVCVNARGS